MALRSQVWCTAVAHGPVEVYALDKRELCTLGIEAVKGISVAWATKLAKLKDDLLKSEAWHDYKSTVTSDIYSRRAGSKKV
jgi:hypothetical protein